MVHRALFGSLERFFGILTEHYAGGFPLWLSPEQVRILPLSEEQHLYAQQIEKELLAADIRVKTDTRQGKLNGKVKNAQLEKVPYMLILGKEEESNSQVSVRHRLRGMIGTQSLNEFIEEIQKEDKEKRNLNPEVSH